MKAIVAMADNRVIGCDGKIPWHLPEDLRFFKETTWGKTVVMGRKTYESIGRPLPGRKNIVLSQQPKKLSLQDVLYVSDLQSVVQLCETVEAFVIGGALIYRALLPWCDQIFVTHVKGKGSLKGDTFFPVFEKEFYQSLTLRENSQMKIVRYSRVSKSS